MSESQELRSTVRPARERSSLFSWGIEPRGLRLLPTNLDTIASSDCVATRLQSSAGIPRSVRLSQRHLTSTSARSWWTPANPFCGGSGGSDQLHAAKLEPGLLQGAREGLICGRLVGLRQRNLVPSLVRGDRLEPEVGGVDLGPDGCDRTWKSLKPGEPLARAGIEHLRRTQAVCNDDRVAVWGPRDASHEIRQLLWTLPERPFPRHLPEREAPGGDDQKMSPVGAEPKFAGCTVERQRELLAGFEVPDNGAVDERPGDAVPIP